MQGTVDITADKAEDAIRIACDMVGVGAGMFELRGVNPVLDEDGEIVRVLWEDEEENTPGVEVHKGKRYAPAQMPTPDDVDGEEPRTGGQLVDHGVSTVEDDGSAPRKAVDTSVEKEATKIITESRADLYKRVKDGSLNPFPADKKKQEQEKNDGH